MTGDLLNHRERHALRVVARRLPLRPPRRVYASAQLGERRFRKAHLKRTNSRLIAARLLVSFSSRHLYLPEGCARRIEPWSTARRVPSLQNQSSCRPPGPVTRVATLVA